MDNQKIEICEIFISIQGEGRTIGMPSMFIRTIGCNTAPPCEFCDSKYSWKNGKLYTINELVNKLKTFYHYTWTGGDPTLWLNEILEVKRILKKQRHKYTDEIETNGLNRFDPSLFTYVNVSPKIQCFNRDNIKNFSKAKNVIFKFVIRDNKDIKFWLRLIKELKINKEKVYFMPEATTKEQLNKKSLKLIETCKKEGVNLGYRLQINLWGKKRGK